jgi:chitin synthase
MDKYVLLCILLSLLWFGELIAMGYFLLVKTNIILSRDSEMFLTPHYDGIFFEQHMILNRQTKKKSVFQDLSQEDGRGDVIRRNPRTIFVCSTMYRENEIEMKQMLSSIYNLACNYSATSRDKYESHIFFDGAINGTQIQEFGLQLLSLLEETLHINLKRCKREKTPYGYRLTWDIGMGEMPFTVHFKDKSLVKPKKRWSQVMYMNYILNHRIKMEGLNASDTFILTTDADIDFTPLSADVLLDMLASNERVGAVCARTHPKGYGVLYWYQIFDYAIGHWFQKPAEHILGCVLCSPGCFSVFRCSALKDVLDTYSTEAIGAMEFLMKDMGEDRWLCTLLIKAGWRLEYCAISEDQTYCPTEFDEFFKQRRRWIPSTIANLAQLISEAGSITRRNDTVSILFIIFQAIMVFSTAISPATVILVISSGFQSAFKLTLSDTLVTITILVIVSVFYGLVCLLSSSQTQLDMAKVLTFIFAIVMSVVIVGIFKDTVYSIFHGYRPAVLSPPSCINSTSNSTADAKALENCLKAARYIEELSKSLWKPKFIFPVSTSTIYLGAFAVTFFVAAILHLPEWYCLVHCVWYLLALPSGYLLLLIYSAANLDSQSWGTREGSSGKDKGLLGWWDNLKDYFRKCIACCIWCCRRESHEKEAIHEESSAKAVQEQKIEVVPTYHSRCKCYKYT